MTCPLVFRAKRTSNRTIQLRGYGNAIVPQVAAHFLQAYMDL